jgi:hypothetical protein
MPKSKSRRSRYNGVSTPFRQGRNYTLPFKDTILGSAVITEASTSIPLTNQQLLPSLSTDITLTRLVVFRKVIVEVLPVAVDDQIAGQIQVGEGLSENGPFGIAPFKIASQVNPTMYYMDFRKAATIAPAILKPVRGNTPVTIVRVKFRGQNTTPQDTAVQFRVTSWVDVMPQEAAFDITPLLLSSPPQVLSPAQAADASNGAG